VAYQIVVVGTSLGGLNALEVLLAGLPATFPVPLVVVQHRGVGSDGILRMALQRRTPLRVREPHDKDPILPGRIYLAPPDYHLLVDEGSFALSTDRPVCHARPSIDVLFETAANTYGGDTIGVVLTGASSDGARGAAAIKSYGGLVIIQAPETAESAVMPRAAIAATLADAVLPLPEIALFLNGVCG